MTRSTRVRAAAALSVAGPAIFTADWLIDGWAHRGYSLTAEPISALSAHDAAQPWVPLIGQLAFVVAYVALAWLIWAALGLRGLSVSIFLLLSAAGTVILSLERTICTSTDRAWCTPLPKDAYPNAQWAHGIGTTVGFVSALIAILLTAWAVWPQVELRGLRNGSLIAEAVCLPCVYWFLATVGHQWHGLSEKIFLTTIAVWTAATGVRIALWLDDSINEAARPAAFRHLTA